MEKIPNEILHLIISNLEPPLAPLATVSRHWQAIIETATFREVTLSVQKDRAIYNKFDPVFARASRRNAVRALSYEFGVHDVYLSPQEGSKRLAKPGDMSVLGLIFDHQLQSLPLCRSLKLTPLPWANSFTISGSDPFASVKLLENCDMALKSAKQIEHLEFVGDHQGSIILPTCLRSIPNLKSVSITSRDLLNNRRHPYFSSVSKFYSLGQALLESKFQSLEFLIIHRMDETFSQRDDAATAGHSDGAPELEQYSRGVQRILHLPTLDTIILLGGHTVSTNIFQQPGNNTGISIGPNIRRLEIELEYLPSWPEFLTALAVAVSNMPKMQDARLEIRSSIAAKLAPFHSGISAQFKAQGMTWVPNYFLPRSERKLLKAFHDSHKCQSCWVLTPFAMKSRILATGWRVSPELLAALRGTNGSSAVYISPLLNGL